MSVPSTQALGLMMRASETPSPWPGRLFATAIASMATLCSFALVARIAFRLDDRDYWGEGPWLVLPIIAVIYARPRMHYCWAGIPAVRLLVVLRGK